MTLPDEAAQRRALLLFEQLADRPTDRDRAMAAEPADVVAALRRLEEIAPRARSAFPTEEDRSPHPAPIPLPTVIGAYRLSRVLGEGGMGIVFAADRTDGLFDHAVAIKLIRPGRFSELDHRRFNREMRLLARLDHPGIARLIDGGVTADGWPYIIMEKVDGVTLFDHIAGRAASPVERIDLLLAICDSVQAAHRALIAHGDIKPENVLVGCEGRPRLLDFGVAQLLDNDLAAALEPQTMVFAAPERRAGGRPTVAADIYAVGILIRTVVGLGDRHEPLAMTIRDRDLRAIVERATADEPGARYAGIDSLAADLRRWRGKLPVQARPLTPSYAAGRFAARHPTGSILAAAGVAVVIAMLLYALIGWREAQRRVEDLRGITRFQLTELDQQLADLPRTVALRAQLAARAQGYLDRIASSPESDAALRAQAADGYRRLALLQGAADRPSLGDVGAARLSFARAERLLARGDRRDVARARATIAIDRARMESAALDPATAGRLLATVDPRSLVGDPALAARFMLVRSEIEQWQGKLGQSAASARRARVLLGAQADADGALLTAKSFAAEAEALYYGGAVPVAYRRYAAAHQLLERAHRRWPDDRAIGWARNLSRWELGTTAVELGHAEAALPLLDQFWREADAEAAADPADVVSARRRRIAMTALGQALAVAGRVDEGIALLRRSATEREQWWVRDPGERSRGRDWYIAVAALGDALVAAGRRGEACRLYGQAQTIAGRVSRANRLPALDQANSLAQLRTMQQANCR